MLSRVVELIEEHGDDDCQRVLLDFQLSKLLSVDDPKVDFSMLMKEAIQNNNYSKSDDLKNKVEESIYSDLRKIKNLESEEMSREYRAK
ncbi:hypothetical protein AYI70_g2553, partial [Smittium culicis]